MGMTDDEAKTAAYARQLRIDTLVGGLPKGGDSKPERGHNRGTTTTHRQPGQHPELRGIPLVGSGPGVITGTRPGDGIRLARTQSHATERISYASMPSTEARHAKPPNTNTR